MNSIRYENEASSRHFWCQVLNRPMGSGSKPKSFFCCLNDLKECIGEYWMNVADNIRFWRSSAHGRKDEIQDASMLIIVSTRFHAILCLWVPGVVKYSNTVRMWQVDASQMQYDADPQTLLDDYARCDDDDTSTVRLTLSSSKSGQERLCMMSEPRLCIT